MHRKNSILLAALLLCAFAACGASPSGTAAADNANFIEVPNVRGQTLTDARSTLTAAGFGSVVSNYDGEDFPPDRIIVTAQSPDAGSSADPEKEVTLSCAKKYLVRLELTSDFNLLFNKYDLEICFDDHPIGTIPNGDEFSLTIDTLEGRHTLYASKAGDNDVSTSHTMEITGNVTFSSTIIHGNSISFSDMSTRDGAAEPTPEPTAEPESTAVSEPTAKPASPKHPASYHSSNDRDIAKEGNSGVYAYKSRGMSYTIYYIIDMDEGYVYRFCEGNGDALCDKVKIDGGTLNDLVLITYHDGGSTWQEAFCFNRKYQPDTLLYQDHNYDSYEYYNTDLDAALKLRDTKTIINVSEDTDAPAETAESAETAAPEKTPTPTSTPKTYTDREVKD